MRLGVAGVFLGRLDVETPAVRVGARDDPALGVLDPGGVAVDVVVEGVAVGLGLGQAATEVAETHWTSL